MYATLLLRLRAELAAQAGEHRPAVVVAIPARDEVERIDRCLTALAGQAGAADFGVVLFVNNSTDGTAGRAQSLAPGLPYRLAVVTHAFPDGTANAGIARRVAMDLGAVWLGGAADVSHPRILMTTDADSTVADDWIATAVATLDHGADAVAGTIALDPDDEAKLSPALRRRGAYEAAYGAILTELDARLDPRPHDPWPCHRTRSGANFALTLEAYRAIGGLPVVPVGEDRALADALVANGFRLRHAPDLRVVTSGRLVGRAPGGAADAIRLRNEHPEIVCDDALEDLSAAVFRARWRRRVRALHRDGLLRRTELWARALGLSACAAARAAEDPQPERAWQTIEAASPRLRQTGVLPAELPWRIAVGRVVLAAVRAAAVFNRPARGRRADIPRPGLGAPAAQSAALPR